MRGAPNSTAHRPADVPAAILAELERGICEVAAAAYGARIDYSRSIGIESAEERPAVEVEVDRDFIPDLIRRLNVALFAERTTRPAFREIIDTLEARP